MTECRSRQLSLFPAPARQATAEAAPQRQLFRTQLSPPAVEAASEPPELETSDLEKQVTATDQMLARLSGRFDRPIDSLTLTRNRARIVSARPGPGGLVLRMHRCFVGAPEPVIEALAAFLGGRASVAARKAALAQLREHFRLHGSGDSTPRRRQALVAKGRHFDLAKIRDRVNRQYFDGNVDAEISWSPLRPLARWSRRRRYGGRLRRRGGFSIRLGSYHELDRLVRIHRVLDRADVPLYVIESIVHHEMLHAVLPPVRRDGRRQVHGPDFRQREREYLDFERAEAWLAEHIKRLAALR